MNKRTYIHDILLATALATAAGMAAAGAAFAQDNPIRSLPAKAFDGYGSVRIDEKIAYLPSLQVKWTMRAKFKTGKGGLFTRSHSSSKEVFTELDAPRVQKIADALRQDLVTQLEAAGWDVRTREELGTDLPAYKPMAVDAKAGVTVEHMDNGVYDIDWAVVPASGHPAMPGVRSSMAGISMGMANGRYMQSRPGVNLNVDYAFGTAEIGETASRQLSTAANAALMFEGGFVAAHARGEKRSWMKEPMKVADGVGTLSLIEGSKASTAGNVIRALSGMKTIDKSGYSFEPDWPVLEAAALEAGKAFNAQIVAQLR